MKHFLFALLICLSTSLFGQDSKGAFTFENETIDYGVVEQNSNGERYFSFKNTGKSPIIISKVKESCGCTIAKKPENPIMPDATATINVKYATNRLGKFSKSIVIFSNANEAKKVIRIKGNVVSSSEFAIVNK